jgi:hypothetical protein
MDQSIMKFSKKVELKTQVNFKLKSSLIELFKD